MTTARLAFYTLTITIVVTAILGGSPARAADGCDRECLRDDSIERPTPD